MSLSPLQIAITLTAPVIPLRELLVMVWDVEFNAVYPPYFGA